MTAEQRFERQQDRSFVVHNEDALGQGSGHLEKVEKIFQARGGGVATPELEIAERELERRVFRLRAERGLGKAQRVVRPILAPQKFGGARATLASGDRVCCRAGVIFG